MSVSVGPIKNFANLKLTDTNDTGSSKKSRPVSQIDSFACKAFFAIADSEFFNPSQYETKNIQGEHASIVDALNDKNTDLTKLFTFKKKKGKLHTAHKYFAVVARFVATTASLAIASPVGVIYNGSLFVVNVFRGGKDLIVHLLDKDNTEKSNALRHTAGEIKRFAQAAFTDTCYTLIGAVFLSLDAVLMGCGKIPFISVYFSAANMLAVKVATGSGALSKQLEKTLRMRELGISNQKGKALTISEKDTNVNNVLPAFTRQYNAVKQEMVAILFNHGIDISLEFKKDDTLDFAIDHIEKTLIEKLKLESAEEIDEVLKGFREKTKALKNMHGVLDIVEVPRFLNANGRREMCLQIWHSSMFDAQQ